MEPVIISAAIIFVPVFIISLFVFIIKHGKSEARRRKQDREHAQATGIAARARVVSARVTEDRYSDNWKQFKLVLEIFPPDSSPAFSAGVVWNLEPAAAAAMPPGAFVPVRFERGDMRRVFPETPGARISEQYEMANSTSWDDPETESVVAAAEIAPIAPKKNTVYRRRSNKMLFGLPLWEVAFNLIRKTDRVNGNIKSAKARAVIAVGDSATGLIAVGMSAKGLISIGQFSLGLVSGGVFSVGLLSLGMIGCGLLAGGIFSGGLLAISAAFTGGYIAVGPLAVGRYVLGIEKDMRSPEMLGAFDALKTLTGLGDETFGEIAAVAMISTWAFGFGFLVFSFIAQAIAVRLLPPNDNRLESPRD